MRKTHKAKILFLLLAMVMVLAACSRGSGNQAGGDSSGSASPSGQSDAPAKTVTLEFWHTYSDAEEKVLVEKVKPAFEAAHPNIKLNLTRMPYEGLKQQVIAGVAGDAAPDLMRMDIIWVPEFAAQGALVDLSQMPGFDDVKATLFEGPMQTNFYNGGYFGVPLNTNTKVAIYNKDTLAAAGLTEPPKTMDELVQAAETLKGQGKFGIGLGGVHAWGLLPWFWSLGGKVTNEDYTQVEGYLNSEASVKALETMVDWNNRGLVIPALLGGEPGAWDGVKSGDYLMIDDGPWFFSILNAEAEQSGFDPMEKTMRGLIPAGSGGSISVIGGENLVVFAGSKNKEAAWTFAQWMLTEEPQLMMADVGMIPTNKQAADQMKNLDIPFIDTYVEQLQTAQPRTPIPQWGEMEGIFNLAFEKAIRGEMTPKEALDDAVEQIEAILK